MTTIKKKKIPKAATKLFNQKKKKNFEIGPKGIELLLFIYLNNNNQQEEDDDDDNDDDAHWYPVWRTNEEVSF